MMAQGNRIRQLRWWEWLLFATLLGCFAAQVLLSSPQKSASFDEQYHLTAGYSYLKTGDFRLATTHPPLAGLTGALPLATRTDIALPLDNPLWEQGNRFDFSDVFLWQANQDPQGMLVGARRGITVLGILLVAGLFLWARQLLGRTASWLVLILAVFDPNLIANARLVTTDLPLTAFFTLALWRAWCWLEHDRWYDFVLAGMLGGLAMASKYNGMLVWPVVVIAALVYPRQASQGWGRRLGGVAGMVIAGLLALWAVYRFDFGVPQMLPVQWPVPAPFFWDHLWSTFSGLVIETTVKPDFLLGQVSTGGWWYYFPVALAVKTPLPLLLLCGAGIVAMIVHRQWRRQVVWWLPMLAFLLMGLTGVLTIGYRHMLPAVPFAILLAGDATLWIPHFSRRWVPTAVGGVLVAWLVVGTLRIYPNQESYFNEVAGDWRNWSHILVDSNLDWGQDLPALRQKMADLGVETVNLGYFGKAVPEAYGVSYRPLPGYLRFMEGREVAAYNPYTPAPGWYAISATALRLGTLQPDTTELYAPFREMTPVDRAGYSIYLYQVEPTAGEEVARPVVVDRPIYQLTPAELGIAAGVRAMPKWQQGGNSTIYPQGSGFVAAEVPGFTVVDANFSDVITLLGYATAAASGSPGAPVEVTLYWQVGERAMPQPAPARGAPLTAFVHLVDGDPGNKVAQYDGWDVALQGLEPGDVIAQRVVLEIPAEVERKPYQLLAGVYSPQDWARLPVATPSGSQDLVELGAFEIR
ncbi:MAG: glycosyltransferase family 39 protein [Anaerolineales bacterium]|nr:glycosyltransferase family 39 protein [Anaerolineales bacterium]